MRRWKTFLVPASMRSWSQNFGLGRKGHRKEYKKRSRRKGDGPKLSLEGTKKLGDSFLLYAISRYDEAIEML